MKNTLVILTPGFPANEADSTCVPPQQIFVNALKENYPQLNIVVLSFRYPYQKGYYRWKGGEVISFGGKNKRGFSRLLLWAQVNKKLREINVQCNVIGLLSFWCGECALLGKRFATRYHKKHFCWILGQDAKQENRYIKRMRPSPAELIALSDFIAEEFEKNHGVRPAHVIPPGIDAQLFMHELPVKDIDLLAAGSLIPLKQFAIFLHVIAAIKKEFPAVKAVLAGDGPEKQKLQALAAQLELNDNLIFTGELPHAELLRFMQRTRIFLHPSAYEGFGVVCIEALHAGASMISFCQPMHQEIPYWHIVQTPEEMIALTTNLLKNGQSHTPQTPFLIGDTATAMMRLFGYTEAITR